MRAASRHSRRGAGRRRRHDVRTGRFERSLSALTAAGAAITAAEIYLSHDGASFGNKMMWWPVVVVPTAIPAGIAAVFSAPRRPHRAAADQRGHRGQRPAGHLPALAGHRAAPRRLHPLQPGVRAAGVRPAAGLPGRRDGPARRGAAPGRPAAARRSVMPFRSARSAPSPRSTGAGSPASTCWTRSTRGTTSPPVSCWPGSRRPNDLAFFTPARGRRRRTAAGPAARPGQRPAGAGARPDRRPAGRSARPTAGTTTTCPRTARPGATRCGLDADAAARHGGPASPRCDRDEQARLIQAVQDLAHRRPSRGTTARPPTCGACGPGTPAPRSTPTPGRGTRSGSPARPTRAGTSTPASTPASTGRSPTATPRLRRRPGPVRRPGRAGPPRATTGPCDAGHPS